MEFVTYENYFYIQIVFMSVMRRQHLRTIYAPENMTMLGLVLMLWTPPNEVRGLWRTVKGWV